MAENEFNVYEGILAGLKEAVAYERWRKDHSYYEDLKESLEDALAYERGDHFRCRVSVREIPSPNTDKKD